MPFVLNPLADPIGFMIFYFLLNVPAEGLFVVFKLGLFSSALAFPFVVVGRKINEKLEEKIKKINSLIILFLSTFITSVIFWFAINVWTLVWMGEGFTGIRVASWFLYAAVSFPFVIFGKHLLAYLKRVWKMPGPVYTYITELVMCILFWFVIFVWYSVFILQSA